MNLREYRERAGLSVRELARQSGVNGTHISKVENGDRGLGWNAALKLASVLKCKPQQLLHDLEQQ